MKDHGTLTNLPYSIKKNDETSTLRLEAHVDIFMNAMEEIVKNLNSSCLEEVIYQEVTTTT